MWHFGTVQWASDLFAWYCLYNNPAKGLHAQSWPCIWLEIVSCTGRSVLQKCRKALLWEVVGQHKHAQCKSGKHRPSLAIMGVSGERGQEEEVWGRESRGKADPWAGWPGEGAEPRSTSRNPGPTQATQICTTDYASTDLLSPIRVAEAYPKELSPGGNIRVI